MALERRGTLLGSGATLAYMNGLSLKANILLELLHVLLFVLKLLHEQTIKLNR